MGLLHIVANDKHAILSYRTNKRLNKILSFIILHLKNLTLVFYFYLVLLTLNPFFGGKSIVSDWC